MPVAVSLRRLARAATFSLPFVLAACGGGGGGGGSSASNGPVAALTTATAFPASASLANMCTPDAEKQWVRSYLDESYLWYDKVRDVTPANYNTVADYFNALPRWNSPTVQFEVVTAQVSPGVINVAGTASFVVDADREPLLVKITWVIVREDGEWAIASHHVSSRTPLL